jgi:hypothetical protein
MNLIVAVLTAVLVAGRAAAATQGCDVPSSLAFADGELTRVAAAIKDNHRLDVMVIGSGSSTLPGPEGARYAYPARLEEVLKARLSGTEVRVSTHVRSRETTAEMVAELPKITGTAKPTLVIWQTGTTDAIHGIEPDDFSAKLDEGIVAIQAGGADVILMNMQYSPRTESMIGISTYADVMRWMAQQHSVPLFDRLALMRYWSEEGLFNLYSGTRDYAMARKVHDCIGRALASQIIDASNLDVLKLQTKR